MHGLLDQITNPHPPFSLSTAATSRLEDIASSSASSPGSASMNRTTTSIQEDLASHLPPSTGALAPGLAGPGAMGVSTQGGGGDGERSLGGGGGGGEEKSEGPSVKAYREDIVEGALKEYMIASQEAGEMIAEHVSNILQLKRSQLKSLQSSADLS